MAWNAKPTHDSMRAIFARCRHPSYSYCLRCGMPWKIVSGHETPYGPNIVDAYRSFPNGLPPGMRLLGQGACFPLCDDCWASLTIEQREPYYWTLLRLWDEGRHSDGIDGVSEEQTHQIITAVREGL